MLNDRNNKGIRCHRAQRHTGRRGGIGVSFLTRRRLADALWRLTAPFVLLLQSPALPAASLEWHPVEELQAAAEHFLASRINSADERTTVRAAPLDRRLQLPRCETPLDAFLQRGSDLRSRMTVGVRCPGNRPWKIYVTVDVVVTQSVLVAARTLPRDHTLTATDVVAVDRDVAGLTTGYVSDPASIVGQRLKHQLIEGRTLTPAMLEADVAVHRGQSVTLTVRSNTLAIRMEGKALMDGSVNERIRVENTTSRRIVEGIVRSSEHVEVLVF